MYRRSALIAIPVLAVLSGHPAYAQQVDRPVFDFGAFGTIGVVHSDERQADFARSVVVPRGVGASSSWSADVDTLLGAQASAAVGEKLSAVLQVVAEHSYDNSFRPHVEWANVKYQVTPALSVRAGRTALPIFAHTEARKVGFSLPWVRTPQEVYELVPVTSNDGVDLIWNADFGRIDNTFQLAVGRSTSKYRGTDRVEQNATTRDQFTVADTVDLGSLSLRANYGQAHLTVGAVQPLFDAFRQFGAGGDAIASRYEAQGALARFYGASSSFDAARWFAMAEWGALRSRTHIGDRNAWYVTGGVRFGDFAPYAIHGRSRLDSQATDPGLDTTQLPAAAVPAALQLNAALNGVLGAPPRQSTTSIGVRFDMLRNVSLKAQFDHIDLAPGSSGVLVNLQPGFVRGGDVDLFTVSLDFVL